MDVLNGVVGEFGFMVPSGEVDAAYSGDESGNKV